MIQHLNTDISFCELDGRLFFLDIQNDQYFQLSRALERSLLSYLKAPDDAGVDISRLVKHNLISLTTAAPYDGSATGVALPSESAIETPYPDRRISFDVVRDVFLMVAMMRWQLKIRRLKTVLQALSDYRHSRVSPLVHDQAKFRQRLSEAATAFNLVRPYVPIEMCCLIDSLSMVRFLAKRGLHAHLIMGVASDPFSAHAWVQHGSLVLNETVGTAQAHVPIRVI
ncbi:MULTISPECIES: lasso peptide biosynthesis B2 protein [unclassified Rhodanobacter]|uniref:lasso peptide biosynthesis B2 protein n=1 Tax=unclassified Rhodanobacter TaxID=2621553 RepID=UPI001BDFCA1B|nr:MULTISPECIES: lasso peptide biosynthesis B2 protein [unclassified Rhodanobacter]MBT2145690.1 lasso peptide biosynthesis B2 protein [Rhodanobacter sp. LX-99]MBT2149813.1 lasso peptide biosynthesis B2 protein [Rhodanobacter sp. LX-100]